MEEQDGQTPPHVLQCKGEGVQSLWEGDIEELRKWMNDQHLSHEFIDLITNALLHYHNPHVTITTPSNQLLQQALHDQTRIGWTQFIEGFWSSSFLLSIKQHFENNNIPNSSILLLSKVQRRIWKIAWNFSGKSPKHTPNPNLRDSGKKLT